MLILRLLCLSLADEMLVAAWAAALAYRNRVIRAAAHAEPAARRMCSAEVGE